MTLGYYVHLHVVFACDDHSGLAEAARRHLALLAEDRRHIAESICSDGQWLAEGEIEEGGGEQVLETHCREVLDYLRYLSKQSGPCHGAKGGLSFWGEVTNYGRPRLFVALLRPFFEDILKHGWRFGLCSHEHILVFDECEGEEHASAHEIYLECDSPEAVEKANLIITNHDRLPFAWMQF